MLKVEPMRSFWLISRFKVDVYIHHTTSGAQYTGMTLSHVTIRDMADSGIWLENIYAWDNNFCIELKFTLKFLI